MADAKKPDKGGGGKGKPKPAPSGGGGIFENEWMLYVLVGILLIFVIIPTVLAFFGYSGGYSVPSDINDRISNFFTYLLETASYIFVFISLILILALFYAKTKLKEVMEKKKSTVVASAGNSMADSFQNATTGIAGVANLPGADSAPGPSHLQHNEPDPRWRDIQEQMQSGNPSDWRVAILEADILLEDMLTQMGYQGKNIGERLKTVDRANFTTLNEAWDAHKLRNTIAHEGAGYQLSRSEAEEAIAKFKKVFDEFYFV